MLFFWCQLNGHRGRITIKIVSIFSLILAIIATTSLADNADYYDESDLLVGIPMVSSGARMEQQRHYAPSSVTIIDSEMIEALAPNNLVDIFRLVPGFLSFYTNGSIYGVSGHDLTDDDPRRVEVRVNGRSVYVPAYPTISWESLGITPDDIQRIEVIKGSNVPAYGSNAIIGAIDITTKSPIQESGTHIRATTGDLHTRNINIRSNFKLADGYGQLRLSHRENRGFDGMDDDGSVDHLVLNAAVTPTLQDIYDIEMGVSVGTFGIGDADHPEDFAEDENTSYWLTTGWSRVEERQQWSWYASLHDTQFKQMGGVFGDREATLWETEFEYQITLNKQLRMVSGAGYKYQSITSPLNLDSDGSVDNTILYGFGNAEWRLSEKWLTNAGFMLENQETDDVRISPRVSLHYQLSLQHNLRVSASKAYRSPTVWEYNRETIDDNGAPYVDYHFKADVNMSAEQMENIEIAYFGRFFGGKLDVDWRAFREDMSGGIDHASWRDLEPPVTPNSFSEGDSRVSVFSNYKDWRVSGYDTQITWRPLPLTTVYFNYTNVRFNSARLSRVTPEKISIGTDPYAIPKHVGSIFITRQFEDGWRAAWFTYHQSRTKWRGGGIGSDPIDSWFRHDLVISKKWQLSRREISLDFKMENVSDEVYVEYQAGNIDKGNIEGNYHDRRIFLNASLNW
jgi:iron complex outermembrane receptor protein